MTIKLMSTMKARCSWFLYIWVFNRVYLLEHCSEGDPEAQQLLGETLYTLSRNRLGWNGLQSKVRISTFYFMILSHE
jgi:hypothetical protein